MTDKTKTPLETAADVIDSIASVGEAVGKGLGGLAGTIVTVVAIGAGIVASFLRVANPVVKITRMRSAVQAANAANAEIDAEMTAAGIP